MVSFFCGSATAGRARAKNLRRPISSRHMSMPTASTMIAPITTFCVEVAHRVEIEAVLHDGDRERAEQRRDDVAAAAGEAGAADDRGRYGLQLETDAVVRRTGIQPSGHQHRADGCHETGDDEGQN